MLNSTVSGEKHVFGWLQPQARRRDGAYPGTLTGNVATLSKTTVHLYARRHHGLLLCVGQAACTMARSPTAVSCATAPSVPAAVTARHDTARASIGARPQHAAVTLALPWLAARVSVACMAREGEKKRRQRTKPKVQYHETTKIVSVPCEATVSLVTDTMRSSMARGSPPPCQGQSQW